MSRNRSVTLAEHLDAFVDRQVEEGRYGSVSEVVREGLRLLEVREMKLEALRKALIEGEESGPPTPFDYDEWLAEKMISSKAA